jgi:hypothetical protein
MLTAFGNLLPKVSVDWPSLVNVKPSFKAPDPLPFTKAQLFAFECLMKKIAELYTHTPDAMQLERQALVPVFVYGNETSGGTRYNVIKNMVKLTDDEGRSLSPYAFTQDVFEVWQTHDEYWKDENGKDTDKIIQYAHPVALTSKAKTISMSTGTISTLPKAAKIRGRVYLMYSHELNVLDRYYQNGVRFRRQQITVQVPVVRQYYGWGNAQFSVEEVSTITAWAYLGKHKYWDDKLDGGYTLGRCQLHDYRQDKPSDKIGASAPFYFFNAGKIARGVRK